MADQCEDKTQGSKTIIKLFVLLFSVLLAVASVGGYVYLDIMINDGERRISDGEKEIDRGRPQLEKGKAKPETGQISLAAGKAEYEKAHDKLFMLFMDNSFNHGKGFEDGRKEIAEGNEQLARGEAKIIAGEKRLAAGELELSWGKKQLEMAKGARIACVLGSVFFWSSCDFARDHLEAISSSPFSQKITSARLQYNCFTMESTASLEFAKHTLLMFGVILAVGTFSGLIARLAKIPDVVVFLLLGMMIGPGMLGLVDIKAESTINQLIMIFGSSFILFDGGASIRLKVLKEVWITIVVISTVGVLITAMIAGVAAYYFLGLTPIVALLLGTVIASTDPATLVPVFKQIHIKDRVAQTVVSESAFNDAMGAILTFTVLSVALGAGEFSASDALVDLFKQSLLGIFIGGSLGYLAAFFIAHEKFNFLAEFAPVVALMAVIGAYMGADGLHASGFMAVFVFGIVLGNQESLGFKLTEREGDELEDFVLTTALIMRMFIFILLGTQVNFGLMSLYLYGGIAVVVVFILVARPVTVFLCAMPDRRAKWSFKEMLFMCWTRETGVIPGALAGMLVGMKAPGAQVIASVTFIAILMTILIQATTTKWLAKKLGLMVET